MTNEQTQDAAEAADDTAAETIESLKAELEQLRAQSLIERADLENQRKRLERDVRNACRFANKQLLGEMLPVFDSLEAALSNAPAEDPLRDGVVLTLRELTRVCENNGLVEIAPNPGDGFDPDRHQAMSAVDTDAVPPGAVFQVFQKGYALNEQLLRPALVAVAKHD
ncbi:MAG: nucleotide exchange factor GrpE [Luteimonas sp.]|nr:nucleotide exchange factor GrpE [Luteimonas sp.]